MTITHIIQMSIYPSILNKHLLDIYHVFRKRNKILLPFRGFTFKSEDIKKQVESEVS